MMSLHMLIEGGAPSALKGNIGAQAAHEECVTVVAAGHVLVEVLNFSKSCVEVMAISHR